MKSDLNIPMSGFKNEKEKEKEEVLPSGNILKTDSLVQEEKSTNLESEPGKEKDKNPCIIVEDLEAKESSPTKNK